MFLSVWVFVVVVVVVCSFSFLVLYGWFGFYLFDLGCFGDFGMLVCLTFVLFQEKKIFTCDFPCTSVFLNT